jgi:NitT/TauT family transport system substrate-binding protein
VTRHDASHSDSKTADTTERQGAKLTSRRGFLATGGASVLVALGGCLGLGGSGDQTPSATSTPTATATSTTTTSTSTTESDAGSTTTAQLESVSYRHRYKLTGIGSAVNVVGARMGPWEAEGLDVSFDTSSGSQAAVESVASGKDMFGNAGISSILNLNEDGSDLVIVGQMLDPMGGVVTTGKQDITTWGDLEGKTVGQYPWGSTGVAAKVAMEQEGVDLSKVSFQNVQPGNGEKLLLNGNVDAMIKFFPLSKARLRAQDLSPNVLITSNVLNHLGISLFTRREVVENKPDVVNSFVRGWLKSYQIFANRIDEVFELYKPLAVESFDESIQREALGEYYAAQVPDPSVGAEHGKGWTVSSQMTSTIDTFTDAGLLEGTISADAMYTNEFIEQNEGLAVETASEIYDALEQYDIGPNYI